MDDKPICNFNLLSDKITTLSLVMYCKKDHEIIRIVMSFNSLIAEVQSQKHKYKYKYEKEIESGQATHLYLRTTIN